MAASSASCVFEGATLRNQRGDHVGCTALTNKSVALYFAGEWCPLCRSFTPALKEFHRRYADSVQIVFISSDETQREAEAHYKRSQGDWLALQWDDALVPKLKRQHRVWSGREMREFGRGRRAGVPTVVVIKPDGQEEVFIQGERFGAAALLEWEPHRTPRWPDEL